MKKDYKAPVVVAVERVEANAGGCGQRASWGCGEQVQQM